MNITTAVIAAAGFGSRMLPVTAAVQKDTMPILDRPAIDYVVEDCLKAGVTRVIFIIRPGTRALQDYYLGSPSLEQYLARGRKTEALASLKAIQAKATFEFIEQTEAAGYGTAIPIGLARPRLAANEAVMVSGGDDFSYHTNGSSETAAMIQTFRKSGATALLSGLERPDDELHRYGVLKERHLNGHAYLEDFVEKPAPGTAPSNLINISKYILSPTALNYLDNIEAQPGSGEYYLTDAILSCAKEHPVAVHRAGGKYLDVGSLAGWLEANMILAAASPALQNILRQTLETPINTK